MALGILMVVLSPSRVPITRGGLSRKPLTRRELGGRNSMIEKLLNLRGGDLESEKNRGNALFQQGKYEQARDVYTRALDNAKNRKENICLALLRNRAAANMKLGDYEGAIADSTEVLATDPDCNKALLRRAMAIDKLGDVKRFKMGYRDCRSLIFDGEGATGSDTLTEVNRLEKKLREAYYNYVDDVDEVCKETYKDAVDQIKYSNIIDKAVADLDFACDKVMEKRNGNFSAEWPYKCLELRMSCFKQQSNFEMLQEDLGLMLAARPGNVSLRLMRCMALECCESWPKCLREAESIITCKKGQNPTMAEYKEAEAYIKRMSYYVDKLSDRER
eukprot:CAMPEP_0184490882 /NCGR_PEP_ID=MMETSP0113_2-20130426/19141_1 /TAXON_ID=91329 /ORGANISM="Norrisiella sphaerica, Strain BC52" /LENGTH=331 /DNA_ID=CAMNT_0026875005 /DNA_START=31 /DNA_END=1026 /DNA_ORIENTATION=+